MTSLQTIVKQHQARAAHWAGESVDWGRRREKWLSVLRQLMDALRASFKDAGVPMDQIVDTRHRLTEETLGAYEAPGLEVTIGRDLVAFIPVASLIIGGYGRVDVIGPRDQVKLIADRAQSADEGEPGMPAEECDWVWSAYPDRSRRGGFPLDEAGLANVLEVVLGGA